MGASCDKLLLQLSYAMSYKPNVTGTAHGLWDELRHALAIVVHRLQIADLCHLNTKRDTACFEFPGDLAEGKTRTWGLKHTDGVVVFVCLICKVASTNQ